MALVFSGIIPHSPLLLPSVGKEAQPLLQKTLESIKRLEQELVAAKPETILVISPHGEQLSDAMIVNLNPDYGCDFSEFGDLTTKCHWRSDVMLIDRIREDFKAKHLPLVLDSSPTVSYGAAVPLLLLTGKLPQVKIIPLLTSGLDARAHFNFGKELKDELLSSTAPIAVICSADLSPRVSPDSPEGFSPRGVAFDEKVVEICTKSEPLGILDIDADWSTEAKACGTKPLAMLAGMMHEIKHECVVLSYEKPLGVGYLTAFMRTY